mgnify:CR=1 FL=1
MENEKMMEIPPTDCPSIFERSVDGRVGVVLPEEPAGIDALIESSIPSEFLRKEQPYLPQVGESDVTRHYTNLANRTLGLDTAFYPLGSCTMKYNPRFHEKAASMECFRSLHPEQPESTMQGMLRIVYEAQKWLGELAGLPAVSFQPAAGAHGELTSMMVIRSYFRSRGETNRCKVIIPDTAHGTNPASAMRSGMSTVEIKSGLDGRIDLEELTKQLGPDTACVMITNPNTLGLFENRIREIADMIHAVGALLYVDGANFNAIVGRVRPGDFGADLMHINVHKTFSCPHGGGGPGAGPICGRDFLAPFMPHPWVMLKDGQYTLEDDCPQSLGKVRAFIGNLPAAVRTWCYLCELGAQGFREVSGYAVLNANYIAKLISGVYEIPYGERCMHEFVLSADKQKHQGARALDLAKGLIDMNYHPPTIYFPHLVSEAMMIEPTETENIETLEKFAAAMLQLAEVAEKQPQQLLESPVKTVVRRLDEGLAARKPVVCWPGNDFNK